MELKFEECTNYFQSVIKGLPSRCEIYETSLNNLAYFCVNALAMLGKLDSLDPKIKSDIITWIYSQQCHEPLSGGFRYSSVHETPNRTVEENHITMTYSSIAMLLLLGDNLERVEKDRIMKDLKSLQNPNGSFKSHHLGSESDVRFSFCAAAICVMLGTNGEIDTEAAVNYVLDCQTYEGGFAHEPGDEAHGGATYCAISTLKIWGGLDKIKDRRRLAYWMSQRQDDGFNGRTHKLTDTCYSFWIGAPLKTLGWFDEMVDKERLKTFIFSNYVGNGAFRPNSNDDPDILHTHFSIVGLGFCGYPGLEPVNSTLGFVTKNLPEYVRKVVE